MTSLSGTFKATTFNGDISKWNTSRVSTLYHTFWGSKFNRDISKWDTSKVRNLEKALLEDLTVI